MGLLCLLPGRLATAQDPSESNVALRGVLIPTGFQGSQYSGMLQIAVDGSPLPNATWDLDASLAAGGRALEDFSGRVVAGEPDTPVVFEAPVEFAPGAYALTLRARETTAGQSGTRTLEGRWPDPNKEPATVSPVVVLQPARGAFMRGENTRGQGALALGDDDSVRIQLPIAVVSVVCRGPKLPHLLRVERRLEGASSVDFETIDLLPGEDRCAQVRDIIPPGTLGEGRFTYQVQLVTESGVRMASGRREFSAVAGGVQGSRPGS